MGRQSGKTIWILTHKYKQIISFTFFLSLEPVWALYIYSLEEIFPVVFKEAPQELKKGTLDLWWGMVRDNWVDVVHAQSDGVRDKTFEWLAGLTYYQLKQLQEPENWEHEKVLN